MKFFDGDISFKFQKRMHHLVRPLFFVSSLLCMVEKLMHLYMMEKYKEFADDFFKI